MDHELNADPCRLGTQGRGTGGIKPCCLPESGHRVMVSCDVSETGIRMTEQCTVCGCKHYTLEIEAPQIGVLTGYAG